jgi:hypothetical protein
MHACHVFSCHSLLTLCPNSAVIYGVCWVNEYSSDIHVRHHAAPIMRGLNHSQVPVGMPTVKHRLQCFMSFFSLFQIESRDVTLHIACASMLLRQCGVVQVDGRGHCGCSDRSWWPQGRARLCDRPPSTPRGRKIQHKSVCPPSTGASPRTAHSHLKLQTLSTSVEHSMKQLLFWARNRSCKSCRRFE